MKFGFHHAAIKAADFQKTLDFYLNGLGFKMVRDWSTPEKSACMIDIGDGGMLEIFSGGTTEAHEEEKWLHLAFSVDDPDAAYEAAIAAGATSHIAPKDLLIQAETPLPVRLAFVRGLNGELLEFFHEK